MSDTTYEDDEIISFEDQEVEEMDALADEEVVVAAKEGNYSFLTEDQGGIAKHKITGMYKEWFLSYASYVILERAVPHLADGLKPVQRRVLHSMNKLDDGRYTKVANIVGDTMKYHPHGDSSIAGALVQLGQKDLLIDCQGNWGNIHTGDGAAASRYIEARLSKFALEVVFNAKTTEWMLSYDGRNNEPVTLPVKFPLLLAQGVEGIAVGLASKILPHNFNELIDASVAYLRGEEYVLYPDFPTGGYVDVSRYNDGMRGGIVKVRAKINKVNSHTLVISEIPFGRNTSTIIASIIKANDINKIKIKKVDDNTAQNVEIVITLSSDVSADKTIDALYAFTDCEISISPNSCVIFQQKPNFIGVKDMLAIATDNTLSLLKQELEIRLSELSELLHFAILSKIFIENRIYLTIEQCESWEEVLFTIEKNLKPYTEMFVREVTQDDIVKLTEIKIKRISKHDASRADEQIRAYRDEVKTVKYNHEHIVDYTIDYYHEIGRKYGQGRERKTEIRDFNNINASTVAVANAKLYVNKKEGFYGIGSSMREDNEFVADCSDIDDVILFNKEGKYIITKVTEKAFYTKNIYYIGVFRRNDSRTIYNILYRDGHKGSYFVKRCSIKGVTRDKEYDITQGTENSEIMYMSVNSNGEAESLKVMLVPRPRMRSNTMELDFAEVAIRGRDAKGNIFTRNMIHKISLKSKGASTLKGQSIWFDEDIKRLNNEGRGTLIGEFSSDDKTIVFTDKSVCYTSGYDETVYFPEDMTTVEKFDLNTIYSVVYFDATQRYYYLKRFKVEDDGKMQQFVDVEDGSYMVAISKDEYPLLHVSYGGVNRGRPAEDIDVDEFIGVKSCRAKGKRLSIYKIETVEFVEPLQKGDVNNGGDQDIEEQEKEEPLVDEALTDSNETKIEPEGRGIINMPSIFDELF
ncbi:MAG: DNA gyrase/topoisomerase IV subunit A [Rikenellaceae bacterium]